MRFKWTRGRTEHTCPLVLFEWELDWLFTVADANNS